MGCYGDSFAFLYIDDVHTSQETPMSCYGDSFAFLYVEDVRTSHEKHMSLAFYGENNYILGTTPCGIQYDCRRSECSRFLRNVRKLLQVCMESRRRRHHYSLLCSLSSLPSNACGTDEWLLLRCKASRTCDLYAWKFVEELKVINVKVQ
jgi:hypothetical protein